MAIYVLKRLVQLLPVLIGVTLLSFLLLRLMPGDPASLMLGARGGPEEVAALRARLGLDLPLWRQYFAFVSNILTGSLGDSMAFGRPVARLVVERLPTTLALVAYSTALAIALTLPLAVVSAARAGGAVDAAIKAVFVVLLATPSFWLGLGLILLFSIRLKLFPTAGPGAGLAGGLRHLFLPALTVALATAAITIRSLRSGLLAAMHANHVDAARAKGLSEGAVMRRHVLPNALIGVISVLGARTSWVIGGTVVVEAVFALPGIGSLFVDAIYGRDYPVVQGVTVAFALLVVAVNLLTDLAYAAADPRIRLG